MRTILKPAAPVEVDGERLDWEDSEEYIKQFSNDLVNEITDDWDEKEMGFAALAQNTHVIESIALGLVIEDAFFAIAAMLFVFFYVAFHLRSLCLSAVGMSLILFSFPISIFICSLIFQVKYYGFLSIVIIYIVFGIGADDIFVFVDAWNQSHFVDKEIIDTD